MTDDKKIESPIISRLLRSESLLLGAIPFVGSLIAFAFESGYLSFYDVPSSLIQLDLVRVITASAVVTLFALVFGILMKFISLVVNGDNPVRKALVRPLSAALVFLPLVFFVPKIASMWWLLGIFFLVMATLELVPPLIKKEPGKSYLERLETQLSQDKEREDSLRVDTSPAGKIDRNFVTPLGMAFFGLLIVFSMGRYQAQTKDSYFVQKENPGLLFVASFGEVLVFKSFDQSTKRITRELRVLKLHEGTPVVLERLKTGVLEAYDPKSGN
jgi:hypothetical protein